MALLLDSLKEFFTKHGNQKKYLIAFSGGLDSHVLLHACCQLQKTFSLNLRAIHINHDLSHNATKWEKHCENLCEQYHLPFVTEKIQVTKSNLEAKARTARYEVFAKYLNANDILLTAHHADDQAETLLLQLCRGGGVKGLAAMPHLKKFVNGYHARPLLNFTRQQLLDYAIAEKLTWLNDESNDNTHFARNFIRHEILPMLTTRWPTITSTLTRTANHCALEMSLLQDYLQNDLQKIIGSQPETLSIAKLLTFSQNKQRLLLREWLREKNIQVPNSKKLATILQTLLLARQDAKPLVTWQCYEMRRYRDDLYVQQNLSAKNTATHIWDLREPLLLPNIGELSVQKKLGMGFDPELKKVIVDFRQGGEKIYLGKRKTKSLKKLFQEWGVLPWQRENIPLLFDGDRLIQVVGFCTDPDYEIKNKNEKGNLIVLDGIPQDLPVG